MWRSISDDWSIKVLIFDQWKWKFIALHLINEDKYEKCCVMTDACLLLRFRFIYLAVRFVNIVEFSLAENGSGFYMEKHLKKTESQQRNAQRHMWLLTNNNPNSFQITFFVVTNCISFYFLKQIKITKNKNRPPNINSILCEPLHHM